VEITGSPGSGRFRLEFRGAWTVDMPRHPAAGELEDYLEAVPTIGPFNVVVSKESNWVYLVEFTGALGHEDVEEMAADYSLPNGCEVLMTTTTQGVSGTVKRSRKKTTG
jgi:hypothetical protein